MAISVTCECGARLEIDEKFLGKEIPCPDCQRPLPTKAPPTPPPLDLPDNRRTSGLAVMSLAVGLIGMFTIIGSLAAIGLGLFAMKIIRQSKKLDGLNLARAGVIVGGVGIFATLVILITPLGLDVIFRELAFLGRISYGSDGVIDTRNGEMVIKRPGAGRWATIENQSQNLKVVDDLIAVNVSADAYLAIQHVSLELNEDEEGIRTKVLERFQKSELVNMLGRLSGRPAPEPTLVAQKKTDGVNEVTADMRLGGIDRRFLILYKTAKNALKVDFFVGCARTNRFDRMDPQFREAFVGFATKK